MNVESGEKYEDVLRWVKFTGIAWKHDNSGFYYSRYPQPGSMPGTPPSTHQQVYWHALGTAQEEDVLIYARPDAPRGRVMVIDLNRPHPQQWQEIVPQGQDVIDTVRLVHNKLVVVSMHHATHKITLYETDGTEAGDVPLPDAGAVAELTGRQRHSELFINYQSFLCPPGIFRYDFESADLQPWFVPQVDFDAGAYETRQIFYTSRDGARVPLFLVHKKGLPRDGMNPTLLYGYSGFTVNQLPAFSVSWLVWLELGGVVAIANLRGGNEYGEEWHRAGMLEKKQIVFDDFIAAAQWLAHNGVTSPQRLAIMGGSNGGLLVAACMLQRPDLFGAVACRVPVADMLRYHRFTAGRYWIPEHGNAEENLEHFRFLYAYSPLHNVRPGVDYPPTLITTADTDDRVVPLHAKKLAATLQAAGSANPVLLRVETRAGHGLGKPTSKAIEELADIFTFLVDRLDVQIE